jgi:hypothetical protein
LTVCSVCSSGRYTTESGTAECSTCAEGLYPYGSFATRCDVCQSGRYKDLPDAQPCQTCLDDTYMPDNTSVVRSQCLTCPTGSSVPYRGAQAVEECRCSIGLWGNGGSAPCLQCPVGGRCIQWNTRIPGVQVGYWRAPQSTEFFECNPKDSCLGDLYNVNGTLIQEAACADGYQGVACGQCVPYQFFRLGDYCRKCPRYPYSLLPLMTSKVERLIFSIGLL